MLCDICIYKGLNTQMFPWIITELPWKLKGGKNPFWTLCYKLQRNEDTTGGNASGADDSENQIALTKPV